MFLLTIAYQIDSKPALDGGDVAPSPKIRTVEVYYTEPKGCYDENRKFFLPGEVMSEEYDEKTNSCSGVKCGPDGVPYAWDGVNCKDKKIVNMF